MTAVDTPVPADALATVCGEMASIFRRRWGRGPLKTRAHWAGPDLLVVMLENGHTDHEKTLRAAGHIQELLGGRLLLQTIVEDELKDMVGRVLGRPVITMLSATRLDPDLSAEIFVLEPRGSNGSNATERGSAEGIAERAEHAITHSAELSDEVRALAAEREQVRRKGAQRRRALP